MSSFFNGWMVYDIIGCLSKREVQLVLEGPVLGPPKDHNWTGPRPMKTGQNEPVSTGSL